MVKNKLILFLVLMVTLGSCQTLHELSIDYMVPGKISFPDQLKRVAVVNNISPASTGVTRSENPTKSAIETIIAMETATYSGDPALAVTTLAEAIAQENYFDVVVICDSALSGQDGFSQENSLSQNEVQSLVESLDVDFIISLEKLQLQATSAIRYLNEWAAYQASIDIKTYSTAKVYLPNRKDAMVVLPIKDSIYWETFGATEGYVRSQIPSQNSIIGEASKFAGNLPVKYLLPTWTTGKRYIYIGGSVRMRDANIHVRNGNWDIAFQLWNEAYQTHKSDKKKMAAAHNMAVYYEMQDSIEAAEKWAIKAQELANKAEKVDKLSQREKGISNIPNYLLITAYLNELQTRKVDLHKLNIQMNRFNDDF